MAKAKSKSKKASVKKVTKAQAVKKALKKTPAKKPAAKKKGTQAKRGKDTVDLECFLTTACIRHKHLPDHCEELQLLRSFRDHYMRSSATGIRLVNDYYLLGPQLVSAIEKDKEKASTYRYIYGCIQKACDKILRNKNQGAQNVYTKMVHQLSKKYLPEI